MTRADHMTCVDQLVRADHVPNTQFTHCMIGFNNASKSLTVMSSPWKRVKPMKIALGKLGEPIPCLVDSTDYRSINDKFKKTGLGLGGRRAFSSEGQAVTSELRWGKQGRLSPYSTRNGTRYISLSTKLRNFNSNVKTV